MMPSSQVGGGRNSLTALMLHHGEGRLLALFRMGMQLPFVYLCKTHFLRGWRRTRAAVYSQSAISEKESTEAQGIY